MGSSRGVAYRLVGISSWKSSVENERIGRGSLRTRRSCESHSLRNKKTPRAMLRPEGRLTFAPPKLPEVGPGAMVTPVSLVLPPAGSPRRSPAFGVLLYKTPFSVS